MADGLPRTTRERLETVPEPVETTRGLVETTRGLLETTRGLVETARGLVETTRGLVETARGLLETTRGLLETTRRLPETARGLLETAHGLLGTAHGPAETKPGLDAAALANDAIPRDPAGMEGATRGSIARLLGLALLASCMPASGASTSGPLALFPMTLVMGGNGRDHDEPIGSLLPDGSIVHRREGLVARLLPDRIVAPDGTPRIVVAPNGDVWVDPKMPPMRFDARGALVSPRGEAVYVDDAGVPSMTELGGKEGPPLGGVHFTPFTPAARRTAEVLFVILVEAAWRRGLPT